MKMKLKQLFALFKKKSSRIPLYDMEALNAAKRAGEDTFVPPRLSDEQRSIVLARVAHMTCPESPVSPEDFESLIPSGLSEEEQDRWFYGGQQEACHTTIVIINTSWKKSELYKRLKEEGLSNALILFDVETRMSLENDVIRWISD